MELDCADKTVYLLIALFANIKVLGHLGLYKLRDLNQVLFILLVVIIHILLILDIALVKAHFIWS